MSRTDLGTGASMSAGAATPKRPMRNMAKILRPTWLGYSMCNVGVSLGLLPVNLFLLYYLTEIVGLPAALAGTAIALPKAWDALVDPAFGGWVDRLSMRLGRRTPAILAATFVFVLSLAATFSLPRHTAPLVNFILVTALLIASSTAQTAIGVSQYALATEMTAGPVELSGLIALSTILAQIFGIAAGGGLPLMISSGGPGAAGYDEMALAVAAVSTAMLAVFAAVTRNIPLARQSADTARLSLWSSLKATAHNHVFYKTIGLVVCLNASIAIQIGFLPFANQYVMGGNADTLAWLEGELGASVLIGMIAAPALVRRRPVMSTMQACNLAVAAGLIALYVSGYGPFWTSAGVLAIIGFGSGVIGILIQTAILEAAALIIPNRARVAIGFYLGIMVAGIKLGSSAGAFASGEILAVFGVRPNAVAQTALALSGLRLGYTIVPLLFVLAGSALIFRASLPRSVVA